MAGALVGASPPDIIAHDKDFAKNRWAAVSAVSSETPSRPTFHTLKRDTAVRRSRYVPLRPNYHSEHALGSYVLTRDDSY
eukprot:7378697-Prymnesium_polylepis.1